MANPAYAFGAFSKDKSTPRGVLRRHRRAQDAKALAEAYADVDRRDAGICLVTGRYTVAGAPDARVRREHHHLKGRRVKPEWITRPERIVTICREAHELVTRGWIVLEGTDARRPIFAHWAAHVTVKPFAIQARRERG